MAPGLMYCNSTKLCLSSEIIKPLSFLLGCCYSNLENQHDRVFKSHLYPQEVSSNAKKVILSTLTCQASRLQKQASLLSLKSICKSNASLMLPPEELWADCCGKGKPFSNHQCSQDSFWIALFAETTVTKKICHDKRENNRKFTVDLSGIISPWVNL